MQPTQQTIPTRNAVGQQVQNGQTPEHNAPERKFKAGSISATVWQNTVVKDGREANYKSVSIERVYKDKNDQWQRTHSFRANDLPKAALVLNKAYEYIALTGMNEE